MTFVQLRYTFLNGHTREPIVIPRTHVTLYDFDAGSMEPGAIVARECMTIYDYDVVFTSDESELVLSPPASSADLSREYCATRQGIGADNPYNPSTLTELARHRSIMFEFHDRSSFDVKFSLHGCCSTGCVAACIPCACTLLAVC